MADLYGTGGLNDTSLLSGPNANTARQIQKAFVNTNNARMRASMRYSLPQLASFNEDNALAQAQTSAGLINSNQQLQNVIDASHATPHGIEENLAQYLPYLGQGLSAIPALFGRGAASSVSNQGLLPWAANKISSWYTDATTGMRFGIGADGRVVGLTDASGNPIQGFGAQGGWPGDMSSADYGGWGSGDAIDAAAGDWGADWGAMDYGTGADWVSGFDVGGW